jgi:uncharacterized protein DUF6578
MDLTVWMSDWELECCGEPFAVGTRVRWTVVKPDREWLTSVLGDRAATVTHMEEHHHPPDGASSVVTGTVRRIWAVSCRYAPRPDDDPRVLHPVPGTAVLKKLTTATGHEPEAQPGYLIELRT